MIGRTLPEDTNHYGSLHVTQVRNNISIFDFEIVVSAGVPKTVHASPRGIDEDPRRGDDERDRFDKFVVRLLAEFSQRG